MISALVLSSGVSTMVHADQIQLDNKPGTKTAKKVKAKSSVPTTKKSQQTPTPTTTTTATSPKTVTVKKTDTNTVKKTSDGYAHPKLKTDSALNDAWQHDSSHLNPVMPWEHDGRNQPVLAQTYGPQHNIVYYRIHNAGSYSDDINKAIANWNSLGVLSLQPTTDDSVNAITITVHNDPEWQPSDNANGMTRYDFSPDYVGAANTMTNTRIFLEPSLDDEDDATKINVVEHEIGHALGFEHDPAQYFNPYSVGQYSYTASVMSSHDFQKANTYQIATIPLGTREANNLRQHYNISN